MNTIKEKIPSQTISINLKLMDVRNSSAFRANMVGKVAVIGAGPSGLSVLCWFAKMKREGRVIPDLVCFEKQSSFGGLWNYSWRTGSDEYGEPVHGSMYRYV